MLSQLESAAIVGVESHPVQVQVDVGPGSAAFTVVGLPDVAVQESRERVRSAIKNSNFEFPAHRITVNLAPADLRKAGPSFDLPIALAILAATGQLECRSLDDLAICGELSLDGSVRPVSGVLPMALGARDTGKRRLMVPEGNRAEASVVAEIAVYPVASLLEAAELLVNPDSRPPAELALPKLSDPNYELDLADVKGQPNVKRALEVAAAGGHNVLMAGPPGSGKTMLARRLPTILPPLSIEEALEVSKVYSISGMLPAGSSLVTTRPFRSPHHTVSTAGLAGGGAIPRPGEVSLAHNGVLFLDELPEFTHDALEVLRQPLEDGAVTISRAQAALTYPARVMLVGAMNPCPCGYLTDFTRPCTCGPGKVRSYLQRISGPLLDRIDIHIEVPKLGNEELLSQGGDGEPSAAVRQRVIQARQVQQQRFRGTGVHCNAHMRPRHLREFCSLNDATRSMLRGAMDQLRLSARAYDRILKLSRTIADLEGVPEISSAHLGEAIQYRGLDRKLWG